MRFKIHLQTRNTRAFLPVDYQYAMASAVYKLIQKGDEAYSRFLHEEGFSAGGLKRFKLFTFSPLALPRFTLQKAKGLFELHGPELSFTVSFMADKAAEAFVKGMFADQQLRIGDRFNQVDMEVRSIEAMPVPLFQDTMEYKCMSAVKLSKIEKGKKHETYIFPDDPQFGEFLINNLISKSLAYKLAGNDIYEAPFEGYKFELLGEFKTKKIKIKPYTPEETEVRGSIFKFRLTAPSFLQEIGYYAGFGENNAMGWGCVEIL
jgi:CRISPR-associated endoribonuclease Cas6